MENNMPDFLKEMLIKQYGIKIAEEIIDGYSKERKVTLRANTIKTSIENIEEELNKHNIEFEKASFSDNTFIIKNAKESDVEELDIYKNGEIYMQSLSSMLPPIVLDPKEGEDILDMAAAPGGKTTQIAAITKNNAHITACEMNNIRAERLKYNIEKQGATSVFIMKEDSRRINDYFMFDRILLDAPCSGSGTISINDKNLNKYFTTKLIEKSTKSQLELLKKAIKVLKPGHEMVYSTCSILSCENEDIVEKAIKGTNAKVIPIDIINKNELPLLPTRIEGTICVKPTELYEGFFIAKIYKEK